LVKLCWLVAYVDLKALDAQFNNDELGASAYDPRFMLKACAQQRISAS
jgi:hypothetical protein